MDWYVIVLIYASVGWFVAIVQLVAMHREIRRLRTETQWNLSETVRIRNELAAIKKQAEGSTGWNYRSN